MRRQKLLPPTKVWLDGALFEHEATAVRAKLVSPVGVSRENERPSGHSSAFFAACILENNILIAWVSKNIGKYIFAHLPIYTDASLLFYKLANSLICASAKVDKSIKEQKATCRIHQTGHAGY